MIVALTAGPSLSASEPAAQPKLAVMPLGALKGVHKDTAKMMTGIVATELAKLGRYEVLSADDVAALIGLEKLKDVAGCSDVACAADIAGGAWPHERIGNAHLEAEPRR